LEHYYREDDEFLDRIITGDGTWVSHQRDKQQSHEWHHAHSPTKIHESSSRHVQLQKSREVFFFFLFFRQER
jgi:hypothetical protein